MNLLNKLTIKNLKLNKKRTIVTIIGIILSVALLTAVSTMYSSLITSLINFETREKGNYHVAFYDVSPDDTKILAKNRMIEDTFNVKNIGYASLNGSDNPNKPYIYLKSFDKKAFENLAITVSEGRLPEKDDEVIIPTHLRTNGRVEYKVGDTLTLAVGTRVDSEGKELNQNNPYIAEDESYETINAETGELLESGENKKSVEKIINPETKTYKIVGIMERPANSVEPYSAPGYTFITYNDKVSEGISDVYIKLNEKDVKNYYALIAGMLDIDEEPLKKYLDGDATYEETVKVTNQINKSKYQFNTNSYLISLETNPLENSSVGSMGGVVAVVCLIIVFTSIFCIKNSFDISITEKAKQYGMLRSIGATKKQIRKNVFYEATILGLIGIPLGLLSGLFASYILVFVSNFFLDGALSNDIKLVFSLSYLAILISVVLGIITIYLSAFRSARRASKTSPIESIRNSANVKIKSKKIKTNKLIHKFFGIGGDISYKNLKRNKKKYRTTVISIIVSVAVFIGLSSFMDMAFNSVKLELGEHEYNIYLNINMTDEAKSKVNEILRQKEINNYTIERTDSLYLDNPKYNPDYAKNFRKSDAASSYLDGHVVLLALGDYQYQKYIEDLGLDYNTVKDKVIIYDYITYQLYDDKENIHQYRKHEFAYSKNDVINLKLDDDKEKSMEVAMVTEKHPFAIPNNNTTTYAIVSDATFDTYSKDGYVTIYFDANNTVKLQDTIEKILGQNYDYHVENVEETAKMMNNLFTLIGIFLYGFIIVISLIGITNIFNTITTNMELRKPEFAMLKSVGMTNQEFNRMIRLESIFMGLKSLLIGIPIGIGLAFLIYYSLDYQENFRLPSLAIMIAIIAVYLLITLIMHYSINKIKNQNTIETIRNENI